jgi:hypothetical protein
MFFALKSEMKQKRTLYKFTADISFFDLQQSKKRWPALCATPLHLQNTESAAR